MATNQYRRDKRDFFIERQDGHDMKCRKPEETRQRLEERKKSGLSVTALSRPVRFSKPSTWAGRVRADRRARIDHVVGRHRGENRKEIYSLESA